MTSLKFVLGHILVIAQIYRITCSTEDLEIPLVLNNVTRCHELIFPDQPFAFALCFQRGSNKQHPYNLYTAPGFCASHYSLSGQLIDPFTLPSNVLQRLFVSIKDLLNSKPARIDLPEPNFLWISSNWTKRSDKEQFWCPEQCHSKGHPEKYLILKTRCVQNTAHEPCLTTRSTHWDRAPFLCAYNQTRVSTVSSSTTSTSTSSPVPSPLPSGNINETKVFYDSDSCLVAQTQTHQYTFCFRRQNCSHSPTSAFCTTKSLAQTICYNEKNQSNLLTIENNEEYRLINQIINLYSDETLLNVEGRMISKYIVPAQWMWINGIRGTNDIYHWNVSYGAIPDHLWCDQKTNCSGGKGRDHIVLNIVCQLNETVQQICLSSRRASEPGPFICKRRLTNRDEPMKNYTYLRSVVKRVTTTSTVSTTVIPIIPVYEKKSTKIYYDEDHCLTVQSSTHLYSFCFRRQTCPLRQAYCTKWSRAEKQCRTRTPQSALLTIENPSEQQLVSDIINEYHHETRLTFNGSSYEYFRLADFLWMDGIQQGKSENYLWTGNKQVIPDYLWCSRNQCDSMGRERVILNLLCVNEQKLICLGTRSGWKLAPFVCKRPRTIDQCPILFPQIENVPKTEMLIVTLNRTIAFIRCRHPDYYTEIKVKYQCNPSNKRWILIYQNKNFTCPTYDVPDMAQSLTASPMTMLKPTTPSPSLPRSVVTTTTITITVSPFLSGRVQCSETEFAALTSQLPTQAHYISHQDSPSTFSNTYDRRVSCHFNSSIHINYRCDEKERRWIYVYGSSQLFRYCYPKCGEEERQTVLDKYFTREQQSYIQTIRRRHRPILRFRCATPSQTGRSKSVIYRCGSLALTSAQWFQLNACSQRPPTDPLPVVVVSMSINGQGRICPPAVRPGSACEYEIGEYIYDSYGCAKKVCPRTSRLCQTIRCPLDRVCQVIPCQSCFATDYLQAVCEYRFKVSLCDMERKLDSLTDEESIVLWQKQAIARIEDYVREQRRRLTNSSIHRSF